MPDIDLRCQDVRAMIAGLPDGCAAFVHADPPWPYEHGNNQGGVDEQYEGLPEPEIAAHLASLYRVAAPDCYLAVWCTFPKLAEWMAVTPGKWQYVTGAAWGKTNGLGVGYHFRGDAELLLLLYRKGSPRPLEGSQSNLWVTGDAGGLVLARRTGHSEKPQIGLRALVNMAAPVGGLVVDCYAGESASLARACRALGRRYVGAEIDPARHARALVRLSQQEMLLEEMAV